MGRCAEFDGRKMLGRREAHRMDRFCQLAVEAVDRAGSPPVPAQRVRV